MRHGVVLTMVLAIPGLFVAVCRGEETPFDKFVDEFFEAHFAWKPSEGTAAGLHQYDASLENWSRDAIYRRITDLKKRRSRLTELCKAPLSFREQIDADMLGGVIDAELLDIETIGTWRRNPMGYVGTPASAIDGLMKRSFAPPAERLKSIIGRLRKTPALLAALRNNVENPPREFTELAQRMARGSTVFFRDTLTTWAKSAADQDADLYAEFSAANAEVVKAMVELEQWLKLDLLPRSKGKYAIGADSFARQMRYEERVDLPLDRLLALGEANLRKDQQEFLETARKIDPKLTPAEVMKKVSDERPTEEDLIPSAKRTVESIRQFLIDKKIVGIPSPVRPTILETPAFARNGSFASMDTPGAYETRATEAFYYVTPTEKDWPESKKEEHLRLFNRPVMEIITIHEAYPGHYIQFLYAKQYPTKTRKLLYCGTNVEGWAHYCEQMMVEEGYGGNDPKIKLAQLSEALLRDCRYVVGIKLHTQGMTVEEGAKFFETQGYQEPSVAYEEARRGAYNPTYLYYTLGKLQIYELREAYRKAKGADYRLESFHNDFVRQGGLPIPLIRRILLEEK